MQDHALGGVEGGGEAVGHRVGDGDELHVEGPDPAALSVGHRDQLGVAEDAGLLEAVAGQSQRQTRPVYGERQMAQQEGEPAGVVLVAVGEDAALEAQGVLDEPAEVGKDEVDAGHLEVGEHEPAVEE